MNRRESFRILAGSAALAAFGMPLLSRASLAQAPAPADGPFKLPPLGYPFEALEPHIDAQTMMIHHDRHHAAYVNVCNQVAKEVPALGTTPIEQTLTYLAYIPVQLQQQVKNNLGGHWNTASFGPDDAGRRDRAEQPAEAAIESSWKDVHEFKHKSQCGRRRPFGSGLAWLVVNKDKKIEPLSRLLTKTRRSRSAPRPSSASMCGSTPIT